MKLLNTQPKKLLTVLIAGFAFAFTSCDNPAAPEDHHEHLHPVGAALFYNGEQIAEYHDGHVHGEIHLHAGKEKHITVKFIAENGELFQPDKKDHFLKFKVLDKTIVAIEYHTEHAYWAFHAIGQKAGETSVVIKLMHGQPGSAHSHFETASIPIHVVKH